MTFPHHSDHRPGDAAIHLDPADWHDLEGEGFDLEERNALRRVSGIRTDLEDRPQKATRPSVIASDPPTVVHLITRPAGGLQDYQELLSKVGEMCLLSLEDLGFGSGEERISLRPHGEDQDGSDPLAVLLTQERIDIVADAIGRLPERERMVVTLYYNEELTMKEVGAVLGLTESRVSQIHSQAMVRLRSNLRGSMSAAE